jgi:hypothetical protein
VNIAPIRVAFLHALGRSSRTTKEVDPMRSIRRSRLAAGTIGACLVAATAAAAFAALTSTADARQAAAPTNTAPPTISGQGQEGQTIKADPGTWSGTTPIDYSYQWRRCGSGGANCRNIATATDQIYTLRSEDVGRTLRVLVTAVNSDGAGTATSKPTDVIKKAPPSAPRNLREPSITGTTQQDQTLTADPGGWGGTQPIDFAYRWRSCDEKGGACANTAVTSKTYTLGQSDVGKTLRVLVTASNSSGSSAAISNATGVVQSSGPAPGSCLSVDKVSLPQRLVVDRIQYTPSTIHSRSEPLVARFHVVTTKGFCVSGAMVLALGVPFNRLSAGQEVQTGSDGWAQVTFTIKPTFPLTPGSLVVIFVRARKPGENLLAGVSTRRLVSVRVG